MRRLKAHYGLLMKSNQRSKAQFRAKSGTVFAVEEKLAAEMALAGFSGNVHVTAANVKRSEA